MLLALGKLNINCVTQFVHVPNVRLRNHDFTSLENMKSEKENNIKKKNEEMFCAQRYSKTK